MKTRFSGFKENKTKQTTKPGSPVLTGHLKGTGNPLPVGIDVPGSHTHTPMERDTKHRTNYSANSRKNLLIPISGWPCTAIGEYVLGSLVTVNIIYLAAEQLKNV